MKNSHDSTLLIHRTNIFTLAHKASCELYEWAWNASIYLFLSEPTCENYSSTVWVSEFSSLADDRISRSL